LPGERLQDDCQKGERVDHSRNGVRAPLLTLWRCAQSHPWRHASKSGLTMLPVPGHEFLVRIVFIFHHTVSDHSESSDSIAASRAIVVAGW